MFLLCCACPWMLRGESIVLGNDNGGNADPFAGPFPGFPGTQYQEAYASSDFPGPISITGIAFFLQPGFNGSTLYGGTYQLSLSVITTNIDDLSEANLNANPGADNTVFATETLAGLAPQILTFSGGPFFYDPSLGNLLLDVEVSNQTSGGSAVFEDGAGHGPAGIVRYSNFYNGTTGYGLVTEFNYSTPDAFGSEQASPEPRTLVLLACGIAGLSVKRWLR
jgi:hypothetical protein